MTTRGNVRARRRRKWLELREVDQLVTVNNQHNRTLMVAGTEFTQNTLILLLLRLSMHVQSGETAGDIVLLEYGIAMVNEDAGAAANFPDPVGPDQIPWLLRDHALLVSPGATVTPQGVITRDYTLRGQRIIRDAQTRLSLILNNTTVAGGGVINYHLTGRALFLLP